MPVALVTGSAGFIGRHFVRELVSRGWTVSGRDLTDGTDALGVFRWGTDVFDLVVHAAAKSPHRAAIDTEPASHIYNQFLDAAMFEWAIRTRQRQVLYLSSCAALDAEPDEYGRLKLTGERMAGQARECGVPVTVVRPYSGYGEDQDERFPFGAFVARARRREDPFEIWGDGTQVRDWIHVDDVVNGALALVDAAIPGPVSLCTGIGTSMRELVDLVCGEAGCRPTVQLRPDMPAGTGRRVGEPAHMLRYYQPQVSLEQGVKRALVAAKA